MNKRKAFLALIMVCALCVLPVFGSFKASADVIAPPGEYKTGYVIDDGVGIGDDTRIAIEGKMSEVANITNLDMVVYFCSSIAATGKSSAQAAADDFYDYGNYGEDGILFLWCVEDQTAHISTTKGTAARILYDNAQANVWAAMQADIKSGNYVEAFNTYGDAVIEYYNAYQKDVNGQAERGPRYGLSGIIAVVVGALSGLIRGGILKGELKSVAEATTATDCIKKDSFKLTRSGEVFLYRKVERTKRNTGSEDKSAAMHTSSSGELHGGNTFK